MYLSFLCTNKLCDDNPSSDPTCSNRFRSKLTSNSVWLNIVYAIEGRHAFDQPSTVNANRIQLHVYTFESIAREPLRTKR